ncbi:hypothetical protein CANARDRAFT_30771 [[Candida] arabinofermentans NRRL YB-2248]|uniref:Uncharacterized protein n=1 Tax=[Candida] arabinofermentans NRRL YB-2248 TaxID=983967 RepID=A0A1E4SSW4_9ASCO|nr:hypothetical protein CANARDRAFT_30771 [[Candida] arabinofermentans NRRL YB-2248]
MKCQIFPSSQSSLFQFQPIESISINRDSPQFNPVQALSFYQSNKALKSATTVSYSSADWNLIWIKKVDVSYTNLDKS